MQCSRMRKYSTIKTVVEKKRTIQYVKGQAIVKWDNNIYLN